MLRLGQITITDKNHRRCFKPIVGDNYPKETDPDSAYRFLDNYLSLIYENDATTNKMMSRFLIRHLSLLESLGSGIYYKQYENKLIVNLGLIELLDQASKYTTDRTGMIQLLSRVSGS
ncbi:MAG: hypothetical protein MHMPM18_004942 [Marteilia pararefringens]